MNPEDLHVTKMKSAKKNDHVLHKSRPCEASKDQSPMQWWYREWNEFPIGCVLPFFYGVFVEELEILKVREESNKVQDLPTRTFRLLESEETKGRCKVSEALLNVWHKVRYSEVIYSKLLEVCERGKVAQGVIVKSELVSGIGVEAKAESFDKRK